MVLHVASKAADTNIKSQCLILDNLKVHLKLVLRLESKPADSSIMFSSLSYGVAC